MMDPSAPKWPLGRLPNLAADLPDTMDALAIERGRYGPPREALRLHELPRPRIHPEDGGKVLVAVLATGPNFNTNFASLGLPVPVFGKGDPARIHVPGSDALGIVVDAGPAVKALKVGQAVVLDSWTSRGAIRGYETHDGFNAQFALVDEERAIPVPAGLKSACPEQLAAFLLTFGTAYRAVVERLRIRPGESVLVMGGGKGTSFPGAQIAKALGARVLLAGSSEELGRGMVRRGFADAFIDRRALPAGVFGVIGPEEPVEAWMERTEPFRRAVREANGGRLVDGVFEHTGGRNFPLLVSSLAEGGRLAFFGATGGGLKGEYKETFFYGKRRMVMDARWVWMRQKQVLFRGAQPREILDEIQLPPGRRGLVWGADPHALDFARAALERQAELCFLVSRTREKEGLAELARMGIPEARILDRDRFDLPVDMPDPLTEGGEPNPEYAERFMKPARALGSALWSVFGPRRSPDFIVERSDQSTLHFSTFLLRDFDDADVMPSGFVLVRGSLDRSILGSHMYRASQARDVLRLLERKALAIEPGDLDLSGLEGLKDLQQRMLDGTLAKPKGAALVQADAPGRTVAQCEEAYLGEAILRAAPDRPLDLHVSDGIGILTLSRPEALNALNAEMGRALAEVAEAIRGEGGVAGRRLRALVVRGAGRAFVAGADLTEFAGAGAERIRDIAAGFIGLFSGIERLGMPVVALVDGFALGGGNELAMAAHYRVATGNASLGQPEVKLGIFPGYGGMQRLPRLVGPRRALELCVNGEPIDAREALAIGLVDEVAPASTALAVAFRRARAMAEGTLATPRRAWDALASAQQAELAALLAEPRVRELAGAPQPAGALAGNLESARAYAAAVILKSLAHGYAAGFEEGLRRDAELFGEIAASPSGQAWIGRFLAKDPAQASYLALLPPGTAGGPGDGEAG